MMEGDYASKNEESRQEDTSSREQDGQNSEESRRQGRRRGRPRKQSESAETSDSNERGDGIHPIKKEEVKQAYPDTAFKHIERGRPFGILRAREDFVMRRVGLRK